MKGYLKQEKTNKFLPAVLFLILFSFLVSNPLLAQFDESYFDIAGLKFGGSMYQTEYKGQVLKESGIGYGGGLFLDRQINGYFTLGYMLEYFYRQVDPKLEADAEKTYSKLIASNNQSHLAGSVLLKFFPIGDFWLGLGPVGYMYYQPEGKVNDAGVAFALGYNFWITWFSKNDIDGQNVTKVLVIAPEIRGSYNLTNLNNTKNQMEFLFYLGIATRAYRPGY